MSIVLGQRQLDEDAMDIVIGVELADEHQQFLVGDCGRQAMADRLNADRLAGFDLPSHVNLRCRILAHQHHGQARRHALCLERLDLSLLIDAHLFGDGLGRR